jgi:predicted ABC-type ATPase
MPEPLLNLAALEPLFAPHEEPNRHRVRAQGDQPAQVKQGRRPSPIPIAQTLRSHVKAWRETDYPGASDTTRELLHHWFGRDHLIETGGQPIPFRYYFCQREAIETLIYLYEVRGIRSLMQTVAEFGGPSAETAALGVNPGEDRWARYAFKLATGAGKTKVMSQPRCIVIAGPNGAGKTTFAREFLPREAGVIHFVNVDLIASGLSPLKPELAAVAAGRLLLQELERLARGRMDFAFESTLSGLVYAARLKRWKTAGYRIEIIFLRLSSAQLALRRIAARVKQGGHDVQREDVLRRFERGWRNFKTAYQPLADVWTVYDNSGESPRLLERGP